MTTYSPTGKIKFNPKFLPPKYKKIYKAALSFYKKGRLLDDVHHLCVAYMMTQLWPIYKADEDIMMAAALLHDTGYARIPKKKRATHWDKQVKIDHMKYGAQIAEKILKENHFPKEKIRKVAAIIATHDNPEIGLPIASPEGRILKEADILWMTTEEAFWLDVKRRQIEPEDLYRMWKKRYEEEAAYKDYLTSQFSKKRVRWFLTTMKGQLKKR
jgi:putative nucleotidyltransferase with HDIG domain